MTKREAREIGGFPANLFIIPLSVVLAILLAAIIVLFLMVNESSSKLSDLMQDYEVHNLDATTLEVDMNVLATTIENSLKHPVKEDGSISKGPLTSYARELSGGTHAPEIAERFRHYEVRDEARAHIESAAEAAERMREIQSHIIALVAKDHPLPPIEELSAIPDVPLTEEELAMTDEERIQQAVKLQTSKEYAPLRTSVSNDIANCKRILQEDYSAESAKYHQRFLAFQSALWVVIVIITVLLVFTIILFYRWLFLPLRGFARRITDDKPMEDVNTFLEMRLVINAYNSLLTRRHRLEAILRSAAETDSLTGLPNRYGMGNYALKLGDEGGSMAVLVFDLNFLKRTNDLHGHLAGDKLLITAGACICECFASEEGNNCFRIGGDEFAAILGGCTEDDIRGRINRFNSATERESISVSVGYAFAEETDSESFATLFELADKRMYEQKEKDHAAAGMLGR